MSTKEAGEMRPQLSIACVGGQPPYAERLRALGHTCREAQEHIHCDAAYVRVENISVEALVRLLDPGIILLLDDPTLPLSLLPELYHHSFLPIAMVCIPLPGDEKEEYALMYHAPSEECWAVAEVFAHDLSHHAYPVSAAQWPLVRELAEEAHHARTALARIKGIFAACMASQEDIP